MARPPRSSRPDLFNTTHMVYLTAAQKRVFHEAAKRSLTSLNAYIRDLLARDVELRAEQGEPYFAGLRDELRAGELKSGELNKSQEQANEEIKS